MPPALHSAGTSLLLLAYRPFIDPVDIQRIWYFLLIPLALGIAITYKAVRIPDMRRYPRQVALMTVQIVIAMLALGAASFLLVQHVAPLILPSR
ncbi:MAG: hypothetical protein IT436_00625 [Phycisphaerales bacterium]|nr:hypothetical protein [Phycisphaerales bacterium]